MTENSIKLIHSDVKPGVKRLYFTVFSALIILLSSGCSLVGINSVEEAAYTVELKENNFELRDYEPMVIVETTIDDDFESAGNKAFKRLFAYITGNNVSNSDISMTAPVIANPEILDPQKVDPQKVDPERVDPERVDPEKVDPEKVDQGRDISMTAPVLQQYRQGGWHYAFVLPAELTLETAPKPLDENVRLAVVAGKKVAVIQYSGFWSEQNMQEKTSELKDWMSANNLMPSSEPRWAGYNPPWTIPFLRRNEVMIDVQ